MCVCFSDVANRRLYWVDSKLHHIASVDLNGAHRRTHISSAETLGHPYALAVFEVCLQSSSESRRSHVNPQHPRVRRERCFCSFTSKCCIRNIYKSVLLEIGDPDESESIQFRRQYHCWSIEATLDQGTYGIFFQRMLFLLKTFKKFYWH